MPVKTTKRPKPKVGRREPLILTTQPVRVEPANPILNPDKRSSLERQFLAIWKAFGMPMVGVEPVEQHRFHESRNWRFDFAWPVEKIAVELEGGVWSRRKMAHNTGAGIQRDIAKHNAAALCGWTVLRYTAKDLKSRPGVVAQQIAALFLAYDPMNSIQGESLMGDVTP